MPATYIERVHGVETSLAIKSPVRVATTANITLTGLQTVDGVALAADDRVLVKDQTDATENGIYVVGISAWSRSIDFNGARDIVQGTEVLAVSGTVNSNQKIQLVTADPVVGTSSLDFIVVVSGSLGGFINRASAIAATIPAPIIRIDVNSPATGTLSYFRDAVGTALSTNSGTVNWSPDGDVYPDHFAENTTPGTTDMMTAFRAARTHGGVTHFKGVDYLLPFTGTIGANMIGGAHLKGVDGSALIFDPDIDSNYRTLMDLPATGGFRMSNIAVRHTRTSGEAIAFFIIRGSNYNFVGCEFDGGMTDDGVSWSSTVYLFSWPETGAYNDFLLHDCEVHHFGWPMLKSNASTSTVRRATFTNNRWHDNYITSLSLNSPNGLYEEVLIEGNYFYHDGTADMSIHAELTAQVALTAIRKAKVINNTFVTGVDTDVAIHLEGRTEEVIVENNNISVVKTGITAQDHNIAGPDYLPTGVISGNVIEKTGTAKEAGSYGIHLIFDASPAPPADRMLIGANTIKDFHSGIISDADISDTVKISDNIIEGCVKGIRITSHTAKISDNTTKDCDNDITSDVSGSVYRHHFINPTLPVEVLTRPVTLHDATWTFDPYALVGATNTFKDLIALGANDRMYGFLTSHIWCEVSVDSANEVSEITWDGTTFTATQKISVTPGSITPEPQRNGGVLQMNLFAATARTAARLEVFVRGDIIKT